MNSKLIEPLNTTQLRSCISTARRREDKDGVRGYKLTNVKIISWLDISEDEQDAIDLHPALLNYPKGESKPNRMRDLKNAARKRARAEKYKRIIAAMSKGMSKKRASRTFKIDIKTVRKIALKVGVDAFLRKAKERDAARSQKKYHCPTIAIQGTKYAVLGGGGKTCSIECVDPSPQGSGTTKLSTLEIYNCSNRKIKENIPCGLLEGIQGQQKLAGMSLASFRPYAWE